MKKRVFAVVGVLAILSMTLVGSVSAAKPTFEPAIYADGEVWSTFTGPDLPAPRGNNVHSFDKLYTFPNDEQMPVAEAAPGKGYNGGRWWVQEVTWNVAPYLLTSEDEVLQAESDEDIDIASTQTYFLCPLLPVK